MSALAAYASQPELTRGRRHDEAATPTLGQSFRNPHQRDRDRIVPVSYTHLTLPTIYSV